MFRDAMRSLTGGRSRSESRVSGAIGKPLASPTTRAQKRGRGLQRARIIGEAAPLRPLQRHLSGSITRSRFHQKGDDESWGSWEVSETGRPQKTPGSICLGAEAGADGQVPPVGLLHTYGYLTYTSVLHTSDQHQQNRLGLDPGSRFARLLDHGSFAFKLTSKPKQKAKLGLVKHVLSYTPLQGCKGPDPIRSQPSDGISPLPPRTNNFCNSTDPTYSTCTYHGAWLPQPFAPGRSRDHCHALESATSSGFRWMPQVCILIWRRGLDRCEETKTAVLSETSCVS
ncbi:hypothetical protein MRS44_012469 [Fusarium solani]|uniref:uncharacterized protein n=1 Tax=Fusarium solani TaxID=169388 RepID=UPI0032C41FDD|nr:hypothetical protein MRS44_012469 [Fusarium solani]